MSDRNRKENFVDLDSCDVLERLAGVPIQTWNYKTQNPAIRHIGPTAQDLYAAFGLGTDDKHIPTISADGIAMGALQGVYELIQDKDRRIADLAAEIAQLEQALASTTGDRAQRFGLGSVLFPMTMLALIGLVTLPVWRFVRTGRGKGRWNQHWHRLVNRRWSQ